MNEQVTTNCKRRPALFICLIKGVFLPALNLTYHSVNWQNDFQTHSKTGWRSTRRTLSEEKHFSNSQKNKPPFLMSLFDRDSPPPRLRQSLTVTFRILWISWRQGIHRLSLHPVTSSSRSREAVKRDIFSSRCHTFCSPCVWWWAVVQACQKDSQQREMAKLKMTPLPAVCHLF